MNNLKRASLTLLVLFTFNSLLFYIAWNGWVWLKVAADAEDILIYAIIFAFLSYSFLLSRFKYTSFLRPISYIWFGVIHFGVVLLPLANLVVLILSLTDVPLNTTIFYVGISVIGIFMVFSGVGLFNAYVPIIRKHDITVPKQVNGPNKLRIAVASDMHFGGLSGVAHVKQLVKKINSLSPDLILLPGDIIDDDPRPFIEKKMDQIMENLHAPLGVYGVLGNHEYYGRQIPVFVEHMKKIGITILMDETVSVGHFYLVGRKDKTDKRRDSFEQLLLEIDRSQPILAMDHQPFELNQARTAGVDVLFSGHTHRGQMAPYHLITKKMYELDWGYLKTGQLHAFVSSGYGFWGPPFRIGSRSEILQVDITFD